MILYLKDVLYEFKKNKALYDYISELLKNTYISKGNTESKNVLDLIEYDFFNGLCWESSSLLSVFFNNGDYVQRGILSLEKNPKYEHGWIEFTYNNEKYIFDASLLYLGTKEIYEEMYNPIYQASIQTEKVKEDLIETIKFGEDVSSIYKFMKERELKKVFTNESNDINNSFYRTKALICADFENNKVKKLYAHLY